MINTAVKHNSIIGKGQEEADKALGSLLKKKTGHYGRWQVTGRDSLASYNLYYDGWLMAKYFPLTESLWLTAWQITDKNVQVSVMNRLLKRFNLRCGVRDNTLWYKQTEGVAHQWSLWNDSVQINLGRTRKCTNQHLWFMTYC